MNVEVKAEGKETENLVGGKRKRDKKFTSAVWAAFDVLPEKTVDSSKKVKCKWCGKVKTYLGNIIQLIKETREHILRAPVEWLFFILKKHGRNLIPLILNMVLPLKKSQLELYFEKPRVDRSMDLNVLHFWKQSAFRYPELAAMARDILSIPVITVAFESTFNVGGKVLDQYRSSLKPEIVEVIVCTKDWLFGDADNNFNDSINDAISLDLCKEDSISTSMKCSSSA
ncbi:hypothetical protein PTKIN_Ptkin03bG0082700 [Pterospermum kingtungense]